MYLSVFQKFAYRNEFDENIGFFSFEQIEIVIVFIFTKPT